jgi:hypothetical protein
MAGEGLKAQNLGAEKYLAPLYLRAEALMSPARYMVEQLEQGCPMEELIRAYSAVS